MAENAGAGILLVRVAAGTVATAMFFFAQAIASADDVPLGGVVLALTAHGLAAAIIFSVFFNSRRTRLQSLVPLAEAPLELKALGREREVRVALDRLRCRLGSTYLAVALVVLTAVLALALAGRGYPMAALVVERRGGYAW